MDNADAYSRRDDAVMDLADIPYAIDWPNGWRNRARTSTGASIHHLLCGSGVTGHRVPGMCEKFQAVRCARYRYLSF